MSNIETNLQNAFETTLTSEMGASDLSAAVASLGSLTSPCYLVIDPDDDQKREYILFDGTFGALSFVTSNINKRYLAGSAYGSNITHSNGAVVRMAPIAQHFEDLNDRIDNVDHGSLSGLGDNDHTQYLLSSAHNKTLHDALNIDADTLDGLDSSDFSAATHNHDSDYAPFSHVNSTTGHPNVVSGGASGFMTGADKATLDALEASGGGVSSVLAGNNIDVSGTSVVTVSHEDTSSVSNISLGTNEHMDGITFDENGHVTGVSKQTMSAGDIGAATSGHDHAGTYAPDSHRSSADHDGRYYTETEVNNLLNAKANLSSANFTGPISTTSTLAASQGVYAQGGTWINYEGGFVKIKKGSTDVFSSNSTDQLYVKGVPHSNVQYDVRCTDSGGGGRRIYYYDDSSTERAKFNIKPTTLTGGECLKWDGAQFQKYLEGEDGPVHEWFIAERIHEASGDAFIVRDEEGLIQNTDDRAMLLDVIITLQDAVEEIQMLKAEIAQLRGE